MMKPEQGSLRVEDVIDPKWLEEYTTERDIIYRQLLEANTMFYILGKIELFPFDLFAANDDRIFWRSIRNALIETIIMIIWRIIVDEAGDALTLKSFKNNVIRHAIDPQARMTIRERVREVNFSKSIKTQENRIRKIRTRYLAHHLVLPNDSPNENELPTLTFGELNTVIDAAWDMFDVLSFEKCHLRWYWGYFEEVRENQQTDIDKLLNQVAYASNVLHLPEREPEFWQIERSNLSSEQIGVLNQYRMKFGLPILE